MAHPDQLVEQLQSIFFEEAEEGLETMEQGLLELDSGGRNPETINAIFRAAHSIKGGSGTFGFSELTELTHRMESLLDAMRAGRQPITSEAVTALLASVDRLRALVVTAKRKERIDADSSRPWIERLEAVLGVASSAAPTGDREPTASAHAGSGWNVQFAPHGDLMMSGNDPVLILRELHRLDEAHVVAQTDRVPDLENLEPEVLYLAWTIELGPKVGEDQIRDAFAWVEDQADLRVTPRAKERPLVTAAPPVPPASPSIGVKPSSATESSSIRVGIDKIDALINIVGELVITQSMLGEIERDFDVSRLDKLRDGLVQLERNTRELQESVMRIRMLPISFAFSRFPRMVRDLSQQLGKKVQLTLAGENTELDKTVMEKIGDPLVHLVRNALDHGLEPPEERVACGKDETGAITLDAFHQGGSIVIEITDDGRGLPADKIRKKAVAAGLVPESDAGITDEQVYDLVFHPGLSTAEAVSDLSGRGVGLDVVRRNIRALGGTVDVQSAPGRGTKFIIRLPLTLAILDGQLISVGDETYIVPLVSIVESLQIDGRLVNGIAGRGEVYRLRDQYIPIVRLHELFGLHSRTTTLDRGLLMVVEGDGRSVGLVVDELLNQQQVVIKSLDANFRRIDGLSGATILGDGTVALILDTPGLIKFAHQRTRGHQWMVTDSSSPSCSQVRSTASTSSGSRRSADGARRHESRTPPATSRASST